MRWICALALTAAPTTALAQFDPTASDSMSAEEQAMDDAVELPADAAMADATESPRGGAVASMRVATQSLEEQERGRLLRARLGEFQECVLASGRLLARGTSEPAEIVARASFGRCSFAATLLWSQANETASVPADEYVDNAKAGVLDELYAAILTVRAGVEERPPPPAR